LVSLNHNLSNFLFSISSNFQDGSRRLQLSLCSQKILNGNNKPYETYKAGFDFLGIVSWISNRTSNYHNDFDRNQQYILSNGNRTDLSLGIRPLFFHHQGECS
jgi:hypothetical protein